VGRYRAAEKALEDKCNAGLPELVATWDERTRRGKPARMALIGDARPSRAS